MPAVRLLALAIALIFVPACGNSTSPGGSGQGDLEVEFRNFSNSGALMGQVGGGLVTVAGNPMTGSPTAYSVTNPGVGNSLDFAASWDLQADTISCTVTSATDVSVPPAVVIQPFGNLDCVDW